MSKATSLDRLRYTFDNFMAKGTIALIGGLGAISFVFIFLISLLITLLGIAPPGNERLNFLEAFWESLMRTLDSGTMGGDQGWGFRLMMLIVTLGGIFVISTLIGLLSSGIESKLEEMRKGRSRVVETDHIVILGWSLQIFTLISELVIANSNRPGSCIVILSSEDKVAMEDVLKERLGKLRHTRLVCRTGSPSDMTDLGMVNIQTARSIVVLTPPDENAESQLIKTLLAIKNVSRQSSQPYHIVVQAPTTKSLSIAKLIGDDEVEGLLLSDTVSRIMVQTCRQSGLSAVYMELLDFGGDEIYLKQEPQLWGKTYHKALSAYENSSVIGLKQNNGSIYLNPPAETLVNQGDQIILIAVDDDTSHPSGLPDLQIRYEAIQKHQPILVQPEKTLLLGWNGQVPQIVEQLDQYVPQGSSVTVVADEPEGQALLERTCTALKHQTLTFQQGDPTDRAILDDLDLPQFNHVIVLCSDQVEPEQADAQTLVTLVQLRDITKQEKCEFAIVTEILDVRNQALAQVTKPDDFVISEQIISRMLAQVSEQKSLNAIFSNLFSSEGSEIYLKPITNYVAVNQPLNFYTVIEAASQRGESAIGYRCAADASNAGRAYGVVINPKNQKR